MEKCLHVLVQDTITVLTKYTGMLLLDYVSLQRSDADALTKHSKLAATERQIRGLLIGLFNQEIQVGEILYYPRAYFEDIFVEHLTFDRLKAPSNFERDTTIFLSSFLHFDNFTSRTISRVIANLMAAKPYYAAYEKYYSELIKSAIVYSPLKRSFSHLQGASCEGYTATKEMQRLARIIGPTNCLNLAKRIRQVMLSQFAAFREAINSKDVEVDLTPKCVIIGNGSVMLELLKDGMKAELSSSIDSLVEKLNADAIEAFAILSQRTHDHVIWSQLIDLMANLLANLANRNPEFIPSLQAYEDNYEVIAYSVEVMCVYLIGGSAPNREYANEIALKAKKEIILKTFYNLLEKKSNYKDVRIPTKVISTLVSRDPDLKKDALISDILLGFTLPKSTKAVSEGIMHNLGRLATMTLKHTLTKSKSRNDLQ